MPVRTLLFQRFLPDRSRFDEDASHIATNVLPIAGTYRPLAQLIGLGSLTPSGTRIEQPVLSAYAHIHTPAAAIQRVLPDERTGSTTWKLDDRSTADADDDLTQQEQEGQRVGTEFYDDGGYVVSPGAATTDLFECTVVVIQQPPALTHFLFLRYKIFDPDDTNAWTVKLRVKAAFGTVATISATGTGEKDWTTAIATLTAPEMGNFVAGDYTTEDQMTLEAEATIAGSNQVKDPDEDAQIGGWLDQDAKSDNPDLFSKLTDASDATFVDSPALGATPEPVRFGIQDCDTPASFANLAVKLKWNSRNSGIKTNLLLFSAGVLVAQLEDDVPPTTATAETKALTVETGVDFPDVDWKDLQVEIAPRYPIQVATGVFAKFLPDVDVDVGEWVVAPLFSKINDDSDATVITSPGMGKFNSKSFEIDLQNTPDIAADRSRERQIIVRARNDDGSNAHKIKIEIIENGASVASTTHTLAAGAALADLNWDLANIKTPSSDVSSTGFVTAPLWPKLGDEANVITSSGTALDKFQVQFPTFVDPKTTAGWLVRITAFVDSGGTSANLNVSLYDETTLLETQSNAVTLDETENTYVVLLSSSAIDNATDLKQLRVEVEVKETGPVVKVRRLNLEAPEPYPAVTDYEGMRLKITSVGDKFGGGWTVSIADAKLEIAAARRIVVYELDLQTDPTSYVGVSWMQMQVPEASSGSQVARGDQVALIAGRLKRLYLVDPQDTGTTVFTDISKGSADLVAGAYPWDFCSWGELLLATNKLEEVQKFDPDVDSLTSDLITSTDKPKGRFIDIARNQAVLANISFSGSPAGFPDEVWGSKDEDAADFDDAGTSGQFRQRLRHTPGEITGFLGGEFMLCWKRTSIIRGSYINAPLYWRFDVISRTVGTTQPDSIVRWRRWIFFYGTDGRFYRTDGASEPVPIDDGVYNDLAPPAGNNQIARVSANFPHELQNRLFGAYDRGSKCIVWVARGYGDNAFENRRIFIWNTVEERFSTAILNFTSSGLSALIETPNVEHNAAFLMYGITGFSYLNATPLIQNVQFSGPDEAVEIDTPVYPMDVDNDGVGYVNKARLLFRADTVKYKLGRAKYTLTIFTWDDRPTQQNARTEVLQSRDANEAGWIECELKGRYVKARLSIDRETDFGTGKTTRALTLGRIGQQFVNPPVEELIGIQVVSEIGER